MRHLFPIVIAVFVVAALTIFVFGDSGVVAYGDLARYKARLSVNVDKLRQHNQELSAELERLRKDTDANSVLAHGIGLYRSDESVVRLEGATSRQEPYVVGDLLRMRRNDTLRNPLFKAIALGVALLLVAYIAIASRKKAHGAQGR